MSSPYPFTAAQCELFLTLVLFSRTNLFYDDVGQRVTLAGRRGNVTVHGLNRGSMRCVRRLTSPLPLRLN